MTIDARTLADRFVARFAGRACPDAPTMMQWFRYIESEARSDGYQQGLRDAVKIADEAAYVSGGFFRKGARHVSRMIRAKANEGDQ